MPKVMLGALYVATLCSKQGLKVLDDHEENDDWEKSFSKIMKSKTEKYL